MLTQKYGFVGIYTLTTNEQDDTRLQNCSLLLAVLHTFSRLCQPPI